MGVRFRFLSSFRKRLRGAFLASSAEVIYDWFNKVTFNVRCMQIASTLKGF